MRIFNLFLLIFVCVCLCFSMSSCDAYNKDTDNDISDSDNADKEDNTEKDPAPSQKIEESYMITYNATMVENNSIGEDWSFGVKFGSEELELGEIVTIDEEETPLFVIFVNEYDAGNSDYTEMSVEFEGLELDEEETQVMTVVVTENDGRFSGNIAVWEFSITCKRVLAEQ